MNTLGKCQRESNVANKMNIANHRNMRWGDYFGLSWRVQSNDKSFLKWKREGIEGEPERCDLRKTQLDVSGFEDRGATCQGMWVPSRRWKGTETGSPKKQFLQKKHNPAKTLVLSQ